MDINYNKLLYQKEEKAFQKAIEKGRKANSYLEDRKTLKKTIEKGRKANTAIVHEEINYNLKLGKEYARELEQKERRIAKANAK